INFTINFFRIPRLRCYSKFDSISTTFFANSEITKFTFSNLRKVKMSTGIPSNPVELWNQIPKWKSFENYHQLWKWSTDNISDFWATVWDYVKIIHSAPYEQVVDSKPMNQIPAWFSGAKLNFAQNLLQCRDENKTAIISVGEGRIPKKISYCDLYDQVRSMAAAMRKVGVKKNDRISAYISNCPEAVIAMLASASICAIWSSASPDFGVSGVLDRFSQIRPKFLFSTNSVVYNGNNIDILPKLKIIVGKRV
ncbi:533_t:CDS:2, partial [Dentiscutata erythropus]